MRCRHYLTVQCMDSPSDSARMMLYRVYLCRPAFHQLLHRFTEFYTIPNLNSRGRPAKLRYHHRILGLVLSFYVESMEQSTLWTLFGAPTSTFSRTLRRAEEALSKALNGFFPLMKVQQPSNADLQNAMCNGWLHAVFVTGRILTPLKDGDFEHLYQSSEVQQERFDHSTFERGLHQRHPSGWQQQTNHRSSP
ncbi:hypothetical protein PC117_g18900 [Phytophthora cactorum]|uniref:Uncharacterized protein n=1 Tax=Phytophthora cactorum TaxID=29920 RepID=A0A8T1C0Z4_9STRA|nr:hypothetical protein PC117_g18900 [Phytophthora cactorum]